MHRHLLATTAILGLLVLAAPLSAQESRRPPRAALGIGVQPTPSDAEHPGLIVREINPDSAASKAGMKNGDVIVRVADKVVRDFDDLANALAAHKPGDKLTFQVLREGKEKKLDVTLGERRRDGGDERGRGPAPAFLGVQVRPLTPDIKTQQGVTVDKGLVVTEVVADSPAQKAGLRMGDVLTAVNDREVADREQLLASVRQAGVGKEVTLKVARGKDMKELKAKLEEVPSDIVPSQPPRGPRSEPFPGGPALRPDELRRIQKLEQQVQELEKRLRELEQKQAKPGSK